MHMYFIIILWVLMPRDWL